MIAARFSDSTVAIVAAVVVVAIVLGYRLLRGDAGIRITRFGVFIERERYDDSDDGEEFEDAEAAETKVLWPKEDK